MGDCSPPDEPTRRTPAGSGAGRAVTAQSVPESTSARYAGVRRLSSFLGPVEVDRRQPWGARWLQRGARRTHSAASSSGSAAVEAASAMRIYLVIYEKIGN